MPDESDQSKIDKLKKALYSRKGVSRSAHILDLNEHKSNVPEKWEEKQEEGEKAPANLETFYEDGSSKLFKKILIGASIFFVFCLAFAAYVYIKGTNLISDTKIVTNVVAPVSAPAGEEMSLDVSITNQNDTEIELADLIVTYPKGTRSAYDKTTEIDNDRISVGTIAPGETVKKTIKLIPFAPDGTKLTVGLSLEYRLPNSSSVFNKDFGYDFLIGSTPATLTLDALKEINSNQDITFTLTLVSNSTETLKSVLLTADIPFGFTFKSADPKPISGGKYVWDLGDIEPSGKRVVKLVGTIVGEPDQNRVFKFSAGTESSKTPGTLDAAFASLEHDVAITRPFLDTEILVNKQNGDFYGHSGSAFNLSLDYTNNLSVPIDDVELISHVAGDIVDKSSISAEGGFYDSNSNTISWSKFETDGLGTLTPGQNGSLPIHFKTFDGYASNMATVRNPSVNVDVTVKGKRYSESNVPEQITSNATRTIKIASDPRLSGRVVHSVGSIENEGSIPPTVGLTTQYTVIWTAVNNFNDITNTKVTAVLPSYVTWTGVTAPSSEKVTFDAESRRVTWDLGKLTAGSTGNSFRQVAFQVSITPSLSQVGFAPIIENAATLSGTDSWTNSTVSDSIKEMDTTLPTDPNYQFGNEKVVAQTGQ